MTSPLSLKLAAALALCIAGPAMAQDIGGGGGASPSLGGAGVSVGESSTGMGGTGAATAGSSTINSINVGDAARTGNFGAATTLGGISDTTGDGFQSTPGSGPADLYNMPRARVGVQLEEIRRALAAGPSATPKPDGS